MKLLAPHERILLAACELFCRDGILAEAGASKMTLRGRFGSQEALVREVLRQEDAAWRRVQPARRAGRPCGLTGGRRRARRLTLRKRNPAPT